MNKEEAKREAQKLVIDYNNVDFYDVLDLIDRIDTADEVLDKARTDLLHLAIGRITELMEKVGHPELDFNGGLRSGYLNVINDLLALKTKKEDVTKPPHLSTSVGKTSHDNEVLDKAMDRISRVAAVGNEEYIRGALAHKCAMLSILKHLKTK